MPEKPHITDKVCSCKFCTMLDVMFGDPKLNSWERDFINSVIFQGWEKDYSPKQKAVIEKTFLKQRKKWLNTKPNG